MRRGKPAKTGRPRCAARFFRFLSASVVLIGSCVRKGIAGAGFFRHHLPGASAQSATMVDLLESDSWYGLARWKKRRRAQLMREPLCRYCLERGTVTVATVADHIDRHDGDWNRFWLGPLQSLCESCHNSLKKRQEARGYKSDIDSNGWPIDPSHPANR